MNAVAARMEAQRRKVEVELIVKMTLKHLGQENVMLSERQCLKTYGTWFRRAVEAGKLIGVPNGSRLEYSVEDILALQSLELQQAKEQAEDYIL